MCWDTNRIPNFYNSHPCAGIFQAVFLSIIKLYFSPLWLAGIFDLFVVVVSFSSHLFAYQGPTCLACFVIQAYPFFVSMPSTGCLVCLVVCQSLYSPPAINFLLLFIQSPFYPRHSLSLTVWYIYNVWYYLPPARCFSVCVL